jgi:chromosome segregation ATPase
MNEHGRSNQLIWGIAIVGVMFLGSMALVWSSTGRLGSEAKAAVPPAHHAAAPHADATAALEKRVLSLEAKANTPPAFDTSQIEAQLKDLGSQISAVQTQLGSFKGADFKALQTKLETKIDKAETTSSQSVKKTVDALQTDLEKLHTRFDQLSQQVASATTSTSSSKHSSHSKR